MVTVKSDTVIPTAIPQKEWFSTISKDEMPLPGFKNPNKTLVLPELDIKKDEGLRYNDGKLRYDLLEPFAIEQLVKVFTQGSLKYAPRNWEKGMKWTSVLASLKRHIAAFEKGEDFDKESGNYHLAHAAWNAMALVSYYKLAPEFDDRQHDYLSDKKVSLDLDDCIVSWADEWAKTYNHPIPKDWDFSYKTKERLTEMSKENIESFYRNLPAKVKPSDINFNIHCYITSRTLDEAVTKEWIEGNGFPTRPVYTVGFGESKVEAFKKSGADYHIDDSYSNFLEMTKAGICCFLLTTPHNEKFEVGYKRIKDFEDFKNRFL